MKNRAPAHGAKKTALVHPAKPTAPPRGVRAFADRHEYVMAALAYSLILVLLLAPFFVAGKVVAAADFTNLSAPWKYHRPADWMAANDLRTDDGLWEYPRKVLFHDETVSNGVPLWDSYKLAGYPFADGVGQAAWFTPLLAWLMVVPAYIFVGLYAFARLLLAGFAAYVFGRTLKVSKAGSFLAGAVFMLSGPLIAWLGSLPTDIAFAFPALLACVEGYLGDGRKRWLLAIPPIVGWVLMLSFPPGMIHLAVITSAYALVRLWQTRASGPSSPWSRLGMLVTSALLGVGIGALGVHTSYLFVTMGGVADRANALLQLPVSSAALLAFPNVFGNTAWGQGGPRLPAIPLSSIHAATNYCESAIYVGLAPLLLAPVAIWRHRRSRKVRALIYLLAAMLLVIYASPLPVNRIIAAIPVIGAVGNLRLLGPVALILAILAGIGLDTLRVREAKTDASLRAWAIAAGVAATAIAAAAVWGISLASQVSGSMQPGERAYYAPYQVREMVTIGLLTLVMAVLVWSVWRFGRRAPWTAWALIVFAIADLLMFAAGFNPMLDRADVLPTTPSIEALQKAADGWRVAPVGDAWVLGEGDIASGYRIQSISGYDWMAISPLTRMLGSVDPAFYQGPANSGSVLHANAKLPSPVLDALGVRYLVADPVDRATVANLSESGYPMVLNSDIVVFENPRALTRAWSVENVVGAATLQDQLSVIGTGTWTPATVAVADGRFAGPYTPATVDLSEWTPGHVRLTVKSAGRAFVVLSEMAIPAWEVRIDDIPSEVIEVNGGMLGTIVPEGEHVLAYRYVSPGFASWSWASAAFLALWAAMAAGWTFLDRRSKRA